MARPLRIEYPGAFYHITVRGNERKDIFKSEKDREQFLSYLATASERYQAVIHVYCLMSNHLSPVTLNPAREGRFKTRQFESVIFRGHNTYFLTSESVHDRIRAWLECRE